MVKRYRVVARVAEMRSQPGKEPCPLYRLGDEFELTSPKERVLVCRWALHSLFPFAAVLEFGGSLPWEPDPDRAMVACPDPHRVVVFELRRAGEMEQGRDISAALKSSSDT